MSVKTSPDRRLHATRRELRDLASSIAVRRRAEGDAAGAVRMSGLAKIVSGDWRPRHDRAW